MFRLIHANFNQWATATTAWYDNVWYGLTLKKFLNLRIILNNIVLKVQYGMVHMYLTYPSVSASVSRLFEHLPRSACS